MSFGIDLKAERARRWRMPLMLAGGVVLVLGGSYFLLTAGEYVSTDDAYVQVGRVSISPDVSARVVEIDVHDNQPVKAGQPLFKLDDRAFRIAVEEANAALATAILKVETEKASYRQTQAELRSAQATKELKKREFARQSQLLAGNATSQTQFDTAKHDLAVAQQAVAVTEQELSGQLSDLAGDADIAPARHPAVRQARAVLDRARLNLSYTVVVAPKDGIVTKITQLQVGDMAVAGTAVFSLVAAKEVWIEANFKETDLTYMADGLPATFTVDAYPAKKFTARVASFSPGTGSAFALLPPENATGNWVKVVQRLPVRLEIDQANGIPLLRSGLSVNVEVRTRYNNPVTRLFKGFSATAGGR